mgnify:CR=1 FL=1
MSALMASGGIGTCLFDGVGIETCRRHVPTLGSVDKYWGHRNKKHKKQPFVDASALHLSLVLWHV